MATRTDDRARAHEKLGKSDLAIKRAFDNLVLTTTGR